MIHWPRKIIHVDMDAFFAAVEQRDHPEYQGKPVVVGGDPYGRGVVSTCSYEARKFGIHSAMPSAEARKRCPNAVFLHPDFEKYEAVSARVMAILRRHTAKVEPVSLDEAYLDVTEHTFHMEDPVMIARLIKQQIHAVTKLTASAGVAPNLFLAKIASDFKKPDGLTVIEPDRVLEFLKDLPVRKIPGVGPVTESELLKLGIRTCSDLEAFGREALIREFGQGGESLYQSAIGEDDREVVTDWEPRQHSREETFEQDIRDLKVLVWKLREFSQEIFEFLSAEEKTGRTVVLKVKYHNFVQITRSKTLSQAPQSSQIIFRAACELLQKTEAGKKPVRLIGLGISGLESGQEVIEKKQQEFDF